jgi:TetR/AcrR family transcriptional repressor of nem operon
LVTSAQELLWERGYTATSPRAIQDRAGVGQGSMYHHFGGKADLARAALERTAEVERARAEELLRDPDRERSEELPMGPDTERADELPVEPDTKRAHELPVGPDTKRAHELPVEPDTKRAEQLSGSPDTERARELPGGPGWARDRLVAYLRRERDALRGCPVGRHAADPDVIADPGLRAPLDETFTWLRGRLAELAATAFGERVDAPALAATIVATVQGGYVLARSAGDPQPFADATEGLAKLLESMGVQPCT